MNIAICEDNARDRAKLRTYLQAYCRDNAFLCDIFEYDSGEALLSAFLPGAFQVLLLDVYLPGLSGVEAAKRIRELDRDCQLLLVTVSVDHALDGYAVQAVSYLVKPLTRAGLEQALSMCRREFERAGRSVRVMVGRDSVELLVSAIRYVEVRDKAVLFHMRDGVVEARSSLDEVERQLADAAFLRCHRSFLVNLSQVEGMGEQDVILKGGELVPIRKNGRREIRVEIARFLSGRHLMEVG